jgi:hypothetical protein
MEHLIHDRGERHEGEGVRSLSRRAAVAIALAGTVILP